MKQTCMTTQLTVILHMTYCKRIEGMYGYIYLTINKVNHKTYVGQKKLGTKAWNKDNYLGSGKHIKCAIKKYGKENFEKFLIQFCYSKEELDKQEIFWIAEYRKRGLAQYNIANGGCGNAGFKHSEETKRRISEIQKGKPKYGLRGKHLSEETRRKLSEAHKGHVVSEETRRKISEVSKVNLKGNKNNKGYHHSDETKNKMSEAHKGKCHSEETKAKIGAANKGNTNNKGKHWRLVDGKRVWY